MQYQVPQFIEVEDKIFFGVFTMKQMGYFGAAFLLTIVAHSFLPFVLFIVVGVVLFGLATAFSFVSINGVHFSKVLLSFFKFFWQPQVYVWRPDKKLLEDVGKAMGVGKSPQEKLIELKSLLKSKLKPTGPIKKERESGGSKILVDHPLIRGFEEKVRQGA